MAQMGLTSSPARWWAARCCGTGREAGGVGQLCKGGSGRCKGRSLLLPGDLVAVGTFLSCDSCCRSGLRTRNCRLLCCPPGTFLRFWKPEVQDQGLVHFEGRVETLISTRSMPSLCPVFTQSSFYPVVCVCLQMSHLKHIGHIGLSLNDLISTGLSL